MSELVLVLKQLESAQFPEEIFGNDPRTSFRRLAMVVHPDHNPNDRVVAQRAFARLQDWWVKAQRRIQKGTYGTKTPDVIFTITTKRRSYEATDIIATGDCSVLYASAAAVLKVVNHTKDNDLLDREVSVLTALRKVTVKGDERFMQHMPEISDTMRGPGARRVNAFAPYPHTVTSLEAIIAAFPDGLDPRDAVWMWRRALRILGYVHAKSYVHGAVTPAHLLMALQDHGILLAGWTAAVREGETIGIIAPKYRDLYPREVLTKDKASVMTDLYMLAKCIIVALGGDPKTNTIPKGVPKGMAALLRGCTMDAPQHRLDNAWWLHDEIASHLIEWFGPRKFRVFAMPS